MPKSPPFPPPVTQSARRVNSTLSAASVHRLRLYTSSLSCFIECIHLVVAFIVFERHFLDNTAMEKRRREEETPKSSRSKRRLKFGAVSEQASSSSRVDVGAITSPSQYPTTPRSQREFELRFEMQRTMSPRTIDSYMKFTDWKEERQRRQKEFGERENISPDRAIMDDDDDHDEMVAMEGEFDSPVVEMPGDEDIVSEFSGFSEGDSPQKRAEEEKEKSGGDEEKGDASAAIGVGGSVGGTASVGVGLGFSFPGTVK